MLENQVLLTIPIILSVGLIWVYKQVDHPKESNLPLKLVGLYILGMISYSYEYFALPIGFIIYLFMAKPKINKKAKKSAVLLGVVVFVINLIVSPFVL
ncbi:hypothetical protein ACERII_15005 [Evansella sp. AB-rgal1]|uniref:hypothetical protein n=1 Tax=Evansella sp. AB-rgal1 TaxID=3242696 RepID=UPI00359E5C8A